MAPPIEIPVDRATVAETGPTETRSIMIGLDPAGGPDRVTVQYDYALTVKDAVTGGVVRSERAWRETVGVDYPADLVIPAFDPVTRTPIEGKTVSLALLRYHVWCATRHFLAAQHGGQAYADLIARLNPANQPK